VTRAFVGLGSNLGDREALLGRAVAELAATPGVELLAVSPVRETTPVGDLEQPPFLNAAAALETELGARALLDRLLAIERGLGRRRDPARRYGPRAIDLDLLLYGQEQRQARGLTVPHPRLHERRFALEPLHDLDPALVVPGRGPIQRLLAELDSER